VPCWSRLGDEVVVFGSKAIPQWQVPWCVESALYVQLHRQTHESVIRDEVEAEAGFAAESDSETGPEDENRFLLPAAVL